MSKALTPNEFYDIIRNSPEFERLIIRYISEILARTVIEVRRNKEEAKDETN